MNRRVVRKFTLLRPGQVATVELPSDAKIVFAAVTGNVPVVWIEGSYDAAIILIENEVAVISDESNVPDHFEHGATFFHGGRAFHVYMRPKQA